jgi:hypothetical protein
VNTVISKTFQQKIVLGVGGGGWVGGMGDRCNYSMTETFSSPSQLHLSQAKLIGGNR